MPLGSSASTVFTFCCTSCEATSTLFSRKNWMTTWLTPSADVLRSSSMPLMVFTAPSILSEISRSMSAGDAPGWMVVTTMTGNSILGNWSTPSCV